MYNRFSLTTRLFVYRIMSGLVFKGYEYTILSGLALIILFSKVGQIHHPVAKKKRTNVLTAEIRKCRRKISLENKALDEEKGKKKPEVYNVPKKY